MIFDGMISLIAKLLAWAGKLIPSINIDTGQFGEKFTELINLVKGMDVILPIKEALIFASVALGIKLAIMIFWALMRMINLIRGAG
jgi:hypothetical protein